MCVFVCRCSTPSQGSWLGTSTPATNRTMRSTSTLFMRRMRRSRWGETCVYVVVFIFIIIIIIIITVVFLLFVCVFVIFCSWLWLVCVTVSYFFFFIIILVFLCFIFFSFLVLVFSSSSSLLSFFVSVVNVLHDQDKLTLSFIDFTAWYN